MDQGRVGGEGTASSDRSQTRAVLNRWSSTKTTRLETVLSVSNRRHPPPDQDAFQSKLKENLDRPAAGQYLGTQMDGTRRATDGGWRGTDGGGRVSGEEKGHRQL